MSSEVTLPILESIEYYKQLNEYYDALIRRIRCLEGHQPSCMAVAKSPDLAYKTRLSRPAGHAVAAFMLLQLMMLSARLS